MSSLGLLTDYNNDSELSEPDDVTTRETKSQVITKNIHFIRRRYNILLTHKKLNEFFQNTLYAAISSIKFTPFLFLMYQAHARR